MAATMVRCRLCKIVQIWQKNIHRNSSTNAYYVLLPEIPPDTVETNPIMRTTENPQFTDISAEKAVTGCAKLAIQYDVQLGKHIEYLKDPKTVKDFHSVFDPIEKFSVPLNFAWKTSKTLSYVKSHEGFRTAFQRIHPQVERAKNERWVSEPLYFAVKEVKADHRNLNKYQDRLVDMYMLEARLNGIEFTGTDRGKFLAFLAKLVDSKNHFRNRVMLSHNMFSHTMEDFSQVVEFPQSLVNQMAVDKDKPSRGPWRVNLNQNIYLPFMEYCSHRLMRWNVWQAYNNRASQKHDSQNLSNHITLIEIRGYRRELAHLLGYENFAEMSMETKMAGSVENVLNMIESLKTKFQPKVTEEIRELQDFANSEGFHSQLEMWDLLYWRRRHRDHLFKINSEDLMPYFPYPKVLDGIFSFCKSLFGIEFKECTKDVNTWHKDVTFYRVFDSETKEELSGLYIDPYSRPFQKTAASWVEAGRERSDLLGTKPLSYMNLQLTPPMGDKPSLMTPEQVAVLFYEFGHALQQLLTSVPYSEISGQRNIEWDTLQTSALVMKTLFYQPSVIRAISGHWETGEPLSDNYVDVILQIRQHMRAYDLIRQLYLSALDMEMYISEEHWVTAMERLWDEFMPLPQNKEDNHPCSLTQIFSDQYAAAYYSFVWSEMIAADIVKSFTDVGLENLEKVSGVGRRYRETYLSLGGGVPASEVFRRFRGRDPSMDPFISLCNGKPEQEH